MDDQTFKLITDRFDSLEAKVDKLIDQQDRLARAEVELENIAKVQLGLQKGISKLDGEKWKQRGIHSVISAIVSIAMHLIQRK